MPVAVNIKLQLAINIIRDLQRINYSRKYNPNGLVIKSNGRDLLLDGYPRLLWYLGVEARSSWSLGVTQDRLHYSFGCCMEQHWPSTARPRKSERFFCGEGVWKN